MNNAKPWDYINSDKTPDEEFNKRVDICSQCNFIFRPTFQCKKCGCFMKIKAKIKHAKCPIGKW